MSAPPPHRSRLPREAVQFRQRARILDATARSVSELGYADCSVEQVAERAGVSKRTFYTRYQGKEQAVAEAYGAAAALAREALGRTLDGVDRWEDAVAATIVAYVSLLECDPAWARFCVVEAPAAGSAVATQRNAVVEDLLSGLERAAPHLSSGALDARLVIEAVDGAVRAWLAQEHPATSAAELVPQLVGLALAQCSGGEDRPAGDAAVRPAVALAAAGGPVRPACKAGSARRMAALSDALDRLPSTAATRRVAGLVEQAVASGDGQLLWHAIVGLDAVDDPTVELESVRRAAARGLRDASIFGLVREGAQSTGWRAEDQRSRCLAYVSDHPGSNGAQVRRGLGLDDAGQVSRLLGALETDGLIETPRPRRGRTNAWRLTAAGQIALAARTKTSPDA